MSVRHCCGWGVLIVAALACRVHAEFKYGHIYVSAADNDLRTAVVHA